MCGIFGYWDRGRRALGERELAAMAASLVHRGPDDEGIRHQRERGVAIGNRRLSIIDLAGGHQPFVSDDGQVAIVQNGEIFNYVELAAELRAQGVRLDSHSDTEVLLRLYEREGLDFVRRLNGMFAIAIDDAREDALTLVRDRIGVKPLYVAEQGDRFLFASEIKALLQALPAQPALDLEAIHHYLTFNYIPAPWTIWQGIRHVMPGCWMKFTRGGTESMQTLIGGYNRLKSGDGVLYADLDYDSMQASMESLARLRGVKVHRIDLPEPATRESLVAAYDQALAQRPEVKLLLLTQLSHRTGLVLPVAQIVAAAKARGVDVLLDSGHALGQLDFSLTAMGVEFAGLKVE